MLSTERTFGGAFFEVPTGMRKKRQFAPSLLQMSATAFAKAALQLTDFCKLTTCRYNVRPSVHEVIVVHVLLGDKFALLRPTHFLFQAPPANAMQQFRWYVPSSK
jgi:hypothetical protein